MSEAATPASARIGNRINWSSVLWVVVVGAIVLIAGPLLMDFVLGQTIYRFFVRDTGDITGINLYLLEALAWGAMIPVLVVKKRWFSGKLKLRVWLLSYLGIQVAYNLWMYALTYNLAFRFSDGKPLKWAAVTNEGIKYYAAPGFGPNGQRLIEVTPETLKKFKTWDKPLARADPRSATWFNVNTRDSELFYVVTPGGDYEFFNRWGYHPGNGVELKPVTPDIKAAYERRTAEVATETAAAAEEERRQRSEQEQRERQRKAEADLQTKRDTLKSLVGEKSTDSNASNVALSVDASRLPKGSSADIQTKLAAELRKSAKGLVIRDDLLRPAFTQDGYFERVFSGDTSFLKDTGLFDSAKFLILCRVRAEAAPNSAMEGMFSSRIELAYRVLNDRGAQIDSGAINAVGPGFSAGAALLRAIELAVEKNGSQLFRSITPDKATSP